MTSVPKMVSQIGICFAKSLRSYRVIIRKTEYGKEN